ncbi:cryptochrome/photolyase family protein [Acanthopleuribacter pedis]|uniref:Deoxyribodipyrimidine photo-lyase n=1 Tax=Acanthopleuribacter pedis TaxID=442870 RepID=A0A8J7QBQ1_9BACT|nr:deoxyribodipyrimidine photo-lyase [Acanthopleuribacter pedis]MBO1322666.1 deoxyribodipyrimidine photo-lyase [Acanthopleuribacter pedis]
MTQQKVNLVWLRRDLRCHDNHALSLALSEDLPVQPLFIFDPTILEKLTSRQDRRVSFIHQTLGELNQQLGQHGAGIWVRHNKPLAAFQELIEGDHPFQIHKVFTNRDYEPYARQRDQQIRDYLAAKGVGFVACQDQAIFECDQIRTKSGDRPYTVYTPYKKTWLQRLEGHEFAPYSGLAEAPDPRLSTMADHFPLPDLDPLGFEPATAAFPDTEPDQSLLAQYDQLRDFPARDAGSKLGIHLRFGTVSVREIAAMAQKVNDTLLSQIIWRDFFFQILFHFPHVIRGAFRPEYDKIAWRESEEDFARWCNGQTGFPIVDAGMRELKETGTMHNRVRMITASFLCKHLLINWRRGERWFAQHLLDYDLAANNGNWQWAAGTGCDAAPYFRVFNPWTQTKKFDPDFRYIKQWVPEHNQPGYPQPMVDHAFARERALATYKQGLGKN